MARLEDRTPDGQPEPHSTFPTTTHWIGLGIVAAVVAILFLYQPIPNQRPGDRFYHYSDYTEQFQGHYPPNSYECVGIATRRRGMCVRGQ